MKTEKVYAKALIDLNSDFVPKDLELLKNTFEQSSELSDIMNNPTVSSNIKKELINDIFKTSVNPQIINFLEILTDEKRFSLLNGIIDEYNNYVDEIKNIERVKVVSAINLSEERKKQIENKLQTRLNKSIIADYEIDKSIIAGLVIKIGDDVIDTSVKNKLDNLSI